MVVVGFGRSKVQVFPEDLIDGLPPKTEIVVQIVFGLGNVKWNCSVAGGRLFGCPQIDYGYSFGKGLQTPMEIQGVKDLDTAAVAAAAGNS